MVPGPVQAAAALAYGDDEHVDVQRARYLDGSSCSATRSRRRHHAPMPDGAFYLWCSKEGMDGWALATFLAERSGLVVSPGELYGDAAATSCASPSCSPTNDSSWPRRVSRLRSSPNYDETMSELETRIGQWFDRLSEMTPENVEARRDVELVITKLDDGQLRVAEIDDAGEVVVHEWVKQGDLLLFRLRGLEKTESDPSSTWTVSS